MLAEPELPGPELPLDALEAAVEAGAGFALAVSLFAVPASGFARCRRGRSGSESESEVPPPLPECDEALAACMAAAFSSTVPFLFMVMVLE